VVLAVVVLLLAVGPVLFVLLRSDDSKSLTFRIVPQSCATKLCFNEPRP
jgi:hypothetical protein